MISFILRLSLMGKLQLKDTAFLLQGGNREGLQENCHGPQWDCKSTEDRVMKIFLPPIHHVSQTKILNSGKNQKIRDLGIQKSECLRKKLKKEIIVALLGKIKEAKANFTCSNKGLNGSNQCSAMLRWAVFMMPS